MNNYKKYISGHTESTLIQLFRYIWVGGLAFLVDYGSLFLLTEYVGLPYLWSAAAAFVLGLIVNYVLSTIWVFSNRNINNKWKEFTVFAIIGVIGLGLNELIMYIGSDVLPLHYMVSKLCSTAIVFFWNFFARKMVLFNKKNDNER